MYLFLNIMIFSEKEFDSFLHMVYREDQEIGSQKVLSGPWGPVFAVNVICNEFLNLLDPQFLQL